VLEALITQIQGRFAELERQMADPEVIADRERYAELGREYRELEPAHQLAREYLQLRDDLEGAKELLAEDGDDPELRTLVADAPGRLEELGDEIRLAMVERDPNDEKSVIIEIQGGAGGDERRLERRRDRHARRVRSTLRSWSIAGSSCRRQAETP